MSEESREQRSVQAFALMRRELERVRELNTVLLEALQRLGKTWHGDGTEVCFCGVHERDTHDDDCMFAKAAVAKALGDEHE